MTDALQASALTVLALALAPAQAAISVDHVGFSYSESFDTLTTSTTASGWMNDHTLPGWHLYISTIANAPTIVAGNGSSNAGSFYSFGTVSSTERALGGVGSGGTYFGSPATGAVAGWIAASFTNNTAVALNGFTIGFNGEQWRTGGAAVPSAQTMEMEYGLGAGFDTTMWFPAGGGFNFTSPVLAVSAAAVDGNAAGKVAGLGGSVGSLAWGPGETLWVRWIERNDAGNDHGLAIDDLTLTVTAVPEPGLWALMLAGLSVVGLVVRRRARGGRP